MSFLSFAFDLRMPSSSSRLLGELLLLVADLHLFELGEMAQLGLEDRFGLDLGELEALHEHGLGLVLAADDADHLVEIQIRRQQAIEDVQPLVDLVEAELQPARDGGGAELPATR